MRLTMDPGRVFYKSVMEDRDAKRVEMMGYDVSSEEFLVSTGFSSCHALALRDMKTGKCCLAHIMDASPKDVLEDIRWCGGDGSEYKGVAGEFDEPGNVKGLHIYHGKHNMLDKKGKPKLLRPETFNEAFAERGFKDISHIPLYPDGYKFTQFGRDVMVDPKTATVYVFPRGESVYFSLPF
ncbi:MAG: hypothetical protein V1813_03375 [Candidatus Aenigmatarchaeota archaeon]